MTNAKEHGNHARRKVRKSALFAPCSPGLNLKIFFLVKFKRSFSNSSKLLKLIIIDLFLICDHLSYFRNYGFVPKCASLHILIHIDRSKENQLISSFTNVRMRSKKIAKLSFHRVLQKQNSFMKSGFFSAEKTDMRFLGQSGDKTKIATRR